MRRFLVCLVCIGLWGCATTGIERPRNIDNQAERAQLRELLKQRYQVGEGYYKEGELDKAKAEFAGMLELKEDEENALYRLGTIAFKQREFDLSATYFSKAIEANPKNKKAHYNLANIRLMQAENHFKYYAALVDKDTDLTKVSKLIVDINSFTTPKNVARKTPRPGSLEALAGALKK